MINTFPQLSYIYNRYKKADPQTPAMIELRITYNKKQKYISTGISVLPHEWKKGIIINRKDALQLNSILDNLLIDIRQILMRMADNGTIDIFSLSTELQHLRDSRMTFIDYCKKRAQIRKYKKASDTQERYNRFIRLFSEWGKIVYFEDINDSSIIAYDTYLASTGMQDYSKWNNYHRFLNSFIKDAIDDGYLQRNPYKWVNINKDKGSKGLQRHLTPEEFYALKSAKMPTLSLERVKDLFVFQTYTCMSYADLTKFNPTHIKLSRGMKIYTGHRQKTSQSFTIPLLPPALDILNKYQFSLPLLSNVKYNQYLKVVAQAAHIDKPISSHWARHTGATLLLNEGVPMGIISKICGHSSTKITEQVYAKLLDDTIVEALEDLTI